MVKDKKYEYDFTQDLNHEIPKVRNITEQNVWAQPEWAGTIRERQGSDVGGTRSGVNVGDPPIKKHSWLKPTWAVVDRKKANTPEDTKNTGGSEHEIITDVVIESNSHPILKTSKFQVDRAKRLALEEQIKAVEAELAAAASAKGEKAASAGNQGKCTSNGSAKSMKETSRPCDTSCDLSAVAQQPQEQQEELKLDALRIAAKQKEDAAWRALEQQRRQEARDRQEVARRALLAGVASDIAGSKTRSDTSWQK